MKNTKKNVSVEFGTGNYKDFTVVCSEVYSYNGACIVAYEDGTEEVWYNGNVDRVTAVDVE